MSKEINNFTHCSKLDLIKMYKKSRRDMRRLSRQKVELEQQIEKLKTELDNARESANRQEQWEIYSVLNDLYNDNFEITKGVSN